MAGATGPVPPLRFTTRDIPVPARRRALHELREQGLLPLEPLPGCTPRVDLLKWRLPGASILSGTFAGVRQGGESGSAAGDDLFFGINVSGCSLAGQRGHEVTVGAGDAVAVDPAAGPFGILRAVPAQMIGLRVPRRSLPAGFGATALRLVPARTAALQLLTGYLRGALSSTALSPGPLADAVVSHITELIELSLDPASRRHPAGQRSRRARGPAGRDQGRYRAATHRRLAHRRGPRRPARHFRPLPAQAVRGRGNDLQQVRPRPAPFPRLPTTAPPAIRHPDHQLDRQRHRLR